MKSLYCLALAVTSVAAQAPPAPKPAPKLRTFIPYSAVTVSTYTHPGSDGKTITVESRVPIARDAQGRRWQQRTLVNGNIEYIDDPVAKIVVILTPGSAVVHPYAAGEPLFFPAFSQSFLAGIVLLPGAAPPQTTQESLPTRSFGCINATGMRSIRVYMTKAGPQPEFATRKAEFWSANGLAVASDTTDSRGMTESFRLEDLKCEPPDPKLFEIPAGGRLTAMGPPPSLGEDSRTMLWQMARTASVALPDPIASANLRSLGRAEAEARVAPEQAAADLELAFARLHAMSPDRFSFAVQLSNQEAQIVSNLTAVHLGGHPAEDFAIALALARTSDSPRGVVYDTLFFALDPRLSQTSGQFADPVALARECLASDGSFPISGAASLFAARGVPHPVLVSLAELMYRTYADGGNPSPLPAQQAFEAAHASVPELDAQLAVTLRVMAKSPGARDGRGRYPNQWALDLLTKIQPEGAADLAALYPALPLALQPRPRPGAPDATLRALAASDPDAALAQIASLATPAQQLNVLNAVIRDSGDLSPVAERATRAAAALLNASSSLHEFNSHDSASIAARLEAIGLHDQADALINRVLDDYAQNAQATQMQLDSRSTNDQLRYLAQGSFGQDGNAQQAFRIAAAIDFPLAMQVVTRLPAAFQPSAWIALAQPLVH